MKILPLSSRTVKLHKLPLIGLAIFAVSLLLIFGHTEYDSALAQSQDDGDGSTSQNGNQGEYTVTLNDVTWGNRFKWVAQAIVAPERLNELVPMYVYEFDAICTILQEPDNSDNSDLHVGVAISEVREHQEIWRARPLSRQDLDTAIKNPKMKNECISGNDSSQGSYIVSSRLLSGRSAVRNLWVPERAWQDGLAPTQSLPNGPLDE